MCVWLSDWFQKGKQAVGLSNHSMADILCHLMVGGQRRPLVSFCLDAWAGLASIFDLCVMIVYEMISASSAPSSGQNHIVGFSSMRCLVRVFQTLHDDGVVVEAFLS